MRALRAGALGVLALGACTHTVKVEPIKVEPIDITLHIYLEADEKLDSFFNFQEQGAATPSGTSTEGAGS